MTVQLQVPLFAPPPVDHRTLRDTDRTVLEAIAKLGVLTTRDAGRIVYRLNRRRRPLDPAIAYRSTGFKVLGRLLRLGLVALNDDGLWSISEPKEDAWPLLQS